MFCLFLGRTGSGKSYEMTVNHVIETLKTGRMVSTNLPLNLDAIFQVYPDFKGLIDIKRYTTERGHPFSTLADYQFTWRHPETNQGPLVIIDEAHKSLPKGRTPFEVLEFLAESRHAGLDIYYATQGIRKMHGDVIDLTDITYRMIKKRVTGQDDKYIRKVIDGVRGDVYDTTTREYNPAYFKFYQSHTASNKAVTEAIAGDVRAWWNHWTVYGPVLCLCFAVITGFQGWLNPFRQANASEEQPHVQSKQSEKPQGIKQATIQNASFTKNDDVNVKKVIPKIQTKQVEPDHPYHKMDLHVSGNLSNTDTDLTLFSASQNGQNIFYINTLDLIEAGYLVEYISECSILLKFEETNYAEYLTCNHAQIAAF